MHGKWCFETRSSLCWCLFSPAFLINAVWSVGPVNICLSKESFGVSAQVCNRSFKMWPFSRWLGCSITANDQDVRSISNYSICSLCDFNGTRLKSLLILKPSPFSEFCEFPSVMCLFIKYSGQFDYTCSWRGVK